MIKSAGILVVIFTFLAVASLNIVWAHRMLTDARLEENGTILINARFGDNLPAKEARVRIFSPEGSLFAEGKTDSRGDFLFTPELPSGKWKAVVTDRMGHRAVARFKIEGLVSQLRGQIEALRKENSLLKEEIQRLKGAVKEDASTRD